MEPWEHAGQHPSRNSGSSALESIASITNPTLGAETRIVPAWRTGDGDPRRFAALARSAMFVVFEGGEPDVHEPTSFTDAYPRSAASGRLGELMRQEVSFVAICLPSTWPHKRMPSCLETRPTGWRHPVSLLVQRRRVRMFSASLL